MIPFTFAAETITVTEPDLIAIKNTEAATTVSIVTVVASIIATTTVIAIVIALGNSVTIAGKEEFALSTSSLAILDRIIEISRRLGCTDFNCS